MGSRNFFPRQRIRPPGDGQVEDERQEEEVFPMVVVEPDAEVTYSPKFFIDRPKRIFYLQVRAPKGKSRKKRLNAWAEAVNGSSAGVMRAARRRLDMTKNGPGRPGWRYNPGGPGSPGWRHDPYTEERS